MLRLLSSRKQDWFSFVCILIPLIAGADVTLTERTQIALLRGSSTVAQHTSWEACLADARNRARAETQTTGSRTFSCQTERRQIVAAYSPTPAPQPVDCVTTDPAWTLGTPEPATCP